MRFILVSLVLCVLGAVAPPSVAGKARDSTGENDDDAGVHIPRRFPSMGNAPTWSYTDAVTAPNQWFRKSPTCGGKRQSPINIELGKVVHDPVTNELQPLLFNYRWMDASSMKEARTAMTLQNVGAGPIFMAKPGSNFQSKQHAHIFELQRIAFRSPSEHAINGKRYAMEAQLYHKSRISGKVSIVSVLFTLGAENYFLNTLNFDFLPKMGRSANVYGQVNVAGILPFNQHYFTYDGSLTEPPCTEGITWYVMQQPVELSAKQLDRLQGALRYASNSRPVQPIGLRGVYASSAGQVPEPLPMSFMEVAEEVVQEPAAPAPAAAAPAPAPASASASASADKKAKLVPAVVSQGPTLVHAKIDCGASPCPEVKEVSSCGCNVCPCATNCGCDACPCQPAAFMKPEFRSDAPPAAPAVPDNREEAIACGSDGAPPCPSKEDLRQSGGFGNPDFKGSAKWKHGMIEADTGLLVQNGTKAKGPTGRLNQTEHITPEMRSADESSKFVSPEMRSAPPAPCACVLQPSCDCSQFAGKKVFVSRSTFHPETSLLEEASTTVNRLKARLNRP